MPLIKYKEFIVKQKYSYENIRLTDWNSRTEQRERPKRDRLIARDVERKCSLVIYLFF